MTSLFDDIDLALLPSARLINRRTAERLDTSHMPTCPHCQELNFPGIARCGNCCSPLFRNLGRGVPSGAREGAALHAALTQPRPTCPTCITELDTDGFCQMCGKERAA